MNEPNSEETIVVEALRLPLADRSAYLDQSTGGNLALRQRVESLLSSYRAGDFLEQAAAPLIQRTVAVSIPLSEKAGDRIGRYKLLQQIGEGGCGVVYMAEQEEPVRRRVALKIIKVGMDTKNVIARFEAERQALAMMDHPNIAKVLDAGATETGRPYFVMELVCGLKITDYCDEAKLSFRARLELFMQVCHAIQHAHQKGIIHRDIKPSNILVTINDGVAVPKVIDFGIAKATGNVELTDKTIFTAFGQFVGTPAYMSPEQAVMTSQDIDTRSDIYALGVLLYELLTGKTPFETKELLAIGLDEMRRTICEREPERPSSRLSTLPENELSTTAQRRGIDAPKLMGQLRGDLDWIVMKCLEKDRARRYETADGLAMDLQRHTSNEPVAARPPSILYCLQKAVRRNKFAFLAGAAVLLALIGGVTVSTFLLFSERKTRRLAVAAEGRARRASDEAEAINAFLQHDLLGQADPYEQVASGHPPDPNLTVKEALHRASDKIGQAFTNQPAVEAGIRSTLGWSLLALGEYKSAIPHFERAVVLFRQNKGPDDRDTLAASVNLGTAYGDYGLANEAISLLEAALKSCRQALGPTNSLTLATMQKLTFYYLRAHRHKDAIGLAEQVVALEKACLGPDDVETARAMGRLGEAYAQAGKPDDGIPLLRKQLELFKLKLSPSNPSILMALNNLATAYSTAGRHAEAIPLLEECFTQRLARDGPLSPSTRIALNNLTGDYRGAGRTTEVLGRFLDPVMTDALIKQPASAGLFRLCGDVAALCGNWAKAETDLTHAIELNPKDSDARHSLAAVLLQRGEITSYYQHCRQGLEQFGNSSDPEATHCISKDCLIMPPPGVDLQLLGRMLDLGVSRGTNYLAWPWTFAAKALAEYRLSRFGSAVEWAGKVVSPPAGMIVEEYGPSWAPVEAYTVLAMARHRLGQSEPARFALANAYKAADSLAKPERGEPNDMWLDWVLDHALLREAEALIHGHER
jgi:tetratricopeptide (TPR) repeat protein